MRASKVSSSQDKGIVGKLLKGIKNKSNATALALGILAGGKAYAEGPKAPEFPPQAKETPALAVQSNTADKVNDTIVQGADSVFVRKKLQKTQIVAANNLPDLGESKTKTGMNFNLTPTGAGITGGFDDIEFHGDLQKTSYGAGVKVWAATMLGENSAVSVELGGGTKEMEGSVRVATKMSDNVMAAVTGRVLEQKQKFSFATDNQDEAWVGVGTAGVTVRYNNADNASGKVFKNFDVSAYMSKAPSKTLGTIQTEESTADFDRIYEKEKRIAGSTTTGVKAGTGIALSEHANLDLSLGIERTKTDYQNPALATDATKTSAVGDAKFLYNIDRHSSAYVGVSATNYSTRSTLGYKLSDNVSIEAFKDFGRNGIAGNSGARISVNIPLGGKATSTPGFSFRKNKINDGGNAVQHYSPNSNPVLAFAKEVPSFASSHVVPVKVDPTVAKVLKFELDKRGIPAGTTIDPKTGNVSVDLTGTELAGYGAFVDAIDQTTGAAIPAGIITVEGGKLVIRSEQLKPILAGSSADKPHTLLLRFAKGQLVVEAYEGSVHIKSISPDQPTTISDLAFSSVTMTGFTVSDAIFDKDGVSNRKFWVYATNPDNNTPSIANASSDKEGAVTFNNAELFKPGTVYYVTETALVKQGGKDVLVSTKAASVKTVDLLDTPTTFDITDMANQALGATITTNAVTVSGINVAVNATTTLGTLVKNGADTGATSTTVVAGDKIAVKVTLGKIPGVTVNGKLTVGKGSDNFAITTIPPVNTPENFDITDMTNQAVSAQVTTNAVTVAGINVAVDATTSVGTIVKNGTDTGAKTTTVVAGDTVAVRLTTSNLFSTATAGTLTIGTKADGFSVTTLAAITTPGNFDFLDLTGQDPSASVTTNTVTVSGINTSVPASTTIGTIVKNGSDTGSASTTVVAGDTVAIKLTASGSYSTTTSGTATIGTKSDSFSVTTRAAATTPGAFDITDMTNQARSTAVTTNTITVSGIEAAVNASTTVGTIVKNGTDTGLTSVTVSNGNTIAIKLTTSASFSTTTSGVLTIGGRTDNFSVTTLGAITNPTAFDITDMTNQAVSTAVTTNAITVAGINTSVTATTNVGTIVKNGTDTGSASTTVVAGDTVAVKLTTAGTPGSTTNGTVTIGGVSDNFSVSTIAAVTTPNVFDITDMASQEVSTSVTTNAVTVAGINVAVNASTNVGTIVKNGTDTTLSSGVSVSSGDTVAVKLTTSGSYSTAVNGTVTIGGRTDNFSVTTRAANTTPNAFDITDMTGQNTSTAVTTPSITVAGLEAATTASTNVGTIVKNGTDTGSASGVSVSNGDTVAVKLTTSGSYSTATNGTVNIGGRTDNFSVTTRAASTTPNAFDITDITGQNTSTVVTTNAITVGGLDTSVTASTNVGTIVKNGTDTGSASGVSVSNGDTVAVKLTTSGSYSTATNGTLTIGGGSDNFSVTTRAANTTPNAFDITDMTGQSATTVVTTNAITVAGLETAVNASTTVGTIVKNGTDTGSSSGVSVNNGDTVAVKLTTGALGSTTNGTVTIGGGTDNFSVSVVGADTTPDAFNITDIAGQNTSTTVTTNAVTITGVNTSVNVSTNVGTIVKNGTDTGSASTTAALNDTIAVKLTTSASYSTAVNGTLTIGTGTDNFSVTTRAAITTPTAFDITDMTNQALNTAVTTNAITVAGLEAAVNASTTVGTIVKNGTDTGSSNGVSVNNGDTVAVKLTTSGSYSTATNGTLTIGGGSDNFSVTTLAAVTAPNAFNIADASGISKNSAYTSNAITVSGINTSVSASTTFGTIVKNGSDTGSASTTVVAGDTVAIKFTPSSYGQVASGTLTIGTGGTNSDNFSFTVESNQAPTITPTADFSIQQGVTSGTKSFSVGDPNSNSTLTVYYATDDGVSTLTGGSATTYDFGFGPVPARMVTVNGSGSVNYTFTGQSGSGLVSIVYRVVDDGGSQTDGSTNVTVTP